MKLRPFLVPRRPPRPLPPAAGNALVIVLLTIAILSAVAANLMWSASARYHVTYQSASWQESLVAAEAGVNLAMAELRKRVRGGESTSFQTPWRRGNSAPDLTVTPALIDVRLLGGGLDPTTVTTGTKPALWPAYPDTGRALPLTQLATHGGEGNNSAWVRVYVDVPGSGATPGANFAGRPAASIDDFMNEQSDAVGYDARTYWWYRIRAVGVAGVSGPARPSIDVRDNRLRRFSFFTDWRTGLPVAATTGPQVGRLVEAVARPQTGFRNALMADVQIDLSDQSVLVDSYNSTLGAYGATYTKDGLKAANVGTLGNVATNGALINAGGATVQGSAMTNDGTVEDADNVSGQRRSDFYQELTKVPAPVASSTATFVLDGQTLNGKTGSGSAGGVAFDGKGGYTIVGSPARDKPTRVYLNGINLTKGPGTVRVKGAPDGSATYAKLIVNGDIKINAPAATDGTNAILLDKGVHAIVYVTGDVNLQGAGITNTDGTADQLLINGVQPANQAADAKAPAIQIQTTQDFQGIIYAPDHDLTLALQAVPASSGGPAAPFVVPAATKKQREDQAKALEERAKSLDERSNDLKENIKELLKTIAKTVATLVPGLQLQIDQKQAQIDANTAEAADLRAQARALKEGNAAPVTQPQLDDHAAGYNGIYGSFVGRKVRVGTKTHIHYDEALRQAGPVNHYEVVNWFEDNATHTAAQ